jgi:DNA modification methylase
VVEAGKYAPIVGDDSIETAVLSSQLCLEQFPNAVQLWWGGNYYAHTLPPSSCWLVWDKENTGNFADAELAWCSDKSAVRIFKHMWNGMLKASEHGQKRVHPSQKPVALAEWAFEKYGKEQDIIFDPFLGSGMSVIAAENLDRTVVGCELSPEYIDIIITRWENHTGEEATLLERSEEVAHA